MLIRSAALATSSAALMPSLPGTCWAHSRVVMFMMFLPRDHHVEHPLSSRIDLLQLWGVARTAGASRMPRRCGQCSQVCGRSEFSSSQWRKGEGLSRCEVCVAGLNPVRCDECGKSFRDANALQQHKRTHQPRNFACPGCNRMYRDLTGTALHFESGQCSACRGPDNARRAAYELVAQQSGGRNFLANPLMITNGGETAGGFTADGPNYRCPSCQRTFRFVSALMQHQQSTQCIGAGRHVNLRIGNGGQHRERRQYKFFHGTTWPKAKEILRNGFIPSAGGCLGTGIYVAREEKALRFAHQRAAETGQGGGLVEVCACIALFICLSVHLCMSSRRTPTSTPL